MRLMDRIDYLVEDDVFIFNHQTYEDKIKYFLKEIKMLCVQYSIVQKIQSESYDENNDVNMVGKLFYDGSVDIAYVYLRSEDFAYFIADRIKYLYWCFHPCSTEIDVISEDIVVLELHYKNKEVIERNEANELKYISI